jgi:uncharacterized protein
MLYFFLNFNVKGVNPMSSSPRSSLRFNFGFLLEATLGTSRTVELNYPSIRVAEDLTLAPLQGEFTATRTSNGVYLGGTLHSALSVECVRCLDDVTIPIAFRIDDLFYYPPSSAPEGEYTIGENGFIDLAPLIRELSLLESPMHPLCRPDCQGLCMQCGQNLNEGDCGCEEDDIDPRLASLKRLLE